LGVTVHVGVGGSTTDLPRLFESLHESVVALHLCLQRDQPLIFYDDQVPSNASKTDAEQPLLPALFNALVEAFRQESAVNIMLTRDSYMQQIIVESTGSLVVMRTHFLDMTYALLGLAEKSGLVDPAAYTQLAKRCCGLLREAQSVSELLDAFQRVQSDLQSVFLSPATGSRDLRLSAVRQYIQENLQNQITLKDTAVRAGLSPFHFSRAFKKHTGLGFQKYLLQQRLEKASRLLRSSQRPAYLIAQECGFYNASHFSKAFQEVFGLTPLKFRKAL
jgi:AraC-like DNA-binding protein